MTDSTFNPMSKDVLDYLEKLGWKYIGLGTVRLYCGSKYQDMDIQTAYESNRRIDAMIAKFPPRKMPWDEKT
jgi:hypothetical protein